MRSLINRLTYPVGIDEYLQLFNPLAGQEPLGIIEKIRPNGTRAVTMSIRCATSWHGHLAGQHVLVGVDINGVRHQRCYSITSAPGIDTRRIEITVGDHPGGTVSSYLNHDVKIGELVHLSEPQGELATTPIEGPNLAITGGTGITPIVSIVRSLANRGHQDRFTIVHFVPERSQMLFAEELDVLSDQRPWLNIVVVETAQDHTHLTSELLDQLAPTWRTTPAYVCGPQPLIDAATELWADPATTSELRSESFSPFTISSEPHQVTRSIYFERAGVTAEANATILDAAESAGLTPPTGCRSGICHTCTATLTNGCATNQRTGQRHTPGSSVQICVTTPDGDCAIDL